MLFRSQVEVLSGLEEGQEVVTGSTKDLMPSESVEGNDSFLPGSQPEDEPEALPETSEPANEVVTMDL